MLRRHETDFCLHWMLKSGASPADFCVSAQLIELFVHTSQLFTIETAAVIAKLSVLSKRSLSIFI